MCGDAPNTTSRERERSRWCGARHPTGSSWRSRAICRRRSTANGRSRRRPRRTDAPTTISCARTCHVQPVPTPPPRSSRRQTAWSALRGRLKSRRLILSSIRCFPVSSSRQTPSSRDVPLRPGRRTGACRMPDGAWATSALPRRGTNASRRTPACSSPRRSPTDAFPACPTRTRPTTCARCSWIPCCVTGAGQAMTTSCANAPTRASSDTSPGWTRR